MNDDSKARHLTTSFTVAETPERVFEAIANVRGWWSGEIEGPTDELGGEFTYRYQDLHYSKQRVTELVPGRRVVWLVLESHLDFIADKTEWNGTKVTFELTRKGAETDVRFTHVGLAPEHECFSACSSAWGSYIDGSLKRLITSGEARPNPKEPRANPASPPARARLSNGGEKRS